MQKSAFSANWYDREIIKVDKWFPYCRERIAKGLQNTQRALGLLLMVEMDIRILKKVPPEYFHPKPSVDSVLIVLERHKPFILKKDYKKYQSFVYKWIKNNDTCLSHQSLWNTYACLLVDRKDWADK